MTWDGPIPLGSISVSVGCLRGCAALRRASWVAGLDPDAQSPANEVVVAHLYVLVPSELPTQITGNDREDTVRA